MVVHASGHVLADPVKTLLSVFDGVHQLLLAAVVFPAGQCVVPKIIGCHVQTADRQLGGGQHQEKDRNDRMGPDGSCDEQETCRGGKHKSQPEEGDVRMGKGAVGKDCQEQVCGGSDRKRDPADFFSVLQKLCRRNDQEDLCRIGIPVPVAAGFFEQGEDHEEGTPVEGKDRDKKKQQKSGLFSEPSSSDRKIPQASQ